MGDYSISVPTSIRKHNPNFSPIINLEENIDNKIDNTYNNIPSTTLTTYNNIPHVGEGVSVLSTPVNFLRDAWHCEFTKFFRNILSNLLLYIYEFSFFYFLACLWYINSLSSTCHGSRSCVWSATQFAWTVDFVYWWCLLLFAFWRRVSLDSLLLGSIFIPECLYFEWHLLEEEHISHGSPFYDIYVQSGRSEKLMDYAFRDTNQSKYTSSRSPNKETQIQNEYHFHQRNRTIATSFTGNTTSSSTNTSSLFIHATHQQHRHTMSFSYHGLLLYCHIGSFFLPFLPNVFKGLPFGSHFEGESRLPLGSPFGGESRCRKCLPFGVMCRVGGLIMFVYLASHLPPIMKRIRLQHNKHIHTLHTLPLFRQLLGAYHRYFSECLQHHASTSMWELIDNNMKHRVPTTNITYLFNTLLVSLCSPMKITTKVTTKINHPFRPISIFIKVVNYNLFRCIFAIILISDNTITYGDCEFNSIVTPEANLPCKCIQEQLLYKDEAKMSKNRSYSPAIYVNPKLPVTLALYCELGSIIANKFASNDGERMSFNSSSNECSASSSSQHFKLCNFDCANGIDHRLRNYFWMPDPCLIRVKFNSKGRVAVVHDYFFEVFWNGKCNKIFELTTNKGHIFFLQITSEAAQIRTSDGSFTGFKFRNPSHFGSLIHDADTFRDATYETAATLNHYLHHDNIVPFISSCLIQRMVTSKPTHSTQTVATAFRTGIYKYGSFHFGPDSLRESLLKVTGFMCSPNFSPTVRAKSSPLML